MAIEYGQTPAGAGDSSGMTISPRVAAAVDRARRDIDERTARGGERVTLAGLARATGVSATHLQRAFTRIVGVSPAVYARMRRAERLRGELRAEPTVSRAVYGAGYGSGSRVYDAASGPALGMTPATYRRGGVGMQIRYTIVASPLGRLLVAVTDRGVCAVTLGDGDAVLADALRSEYSLAEIERVDDGDDWLADLVRQVGETVATGTVDTQAIPLDVRGTAFQWQVWRALQRIPAGETRSYAEIARMIGRPRATRAVGQACGANRVAVVVPCHRVLRDDGSPGGYRWGVARKERLLSDERSRRA